MSGMTAFLIAVSGVALVCYWLMTRVQNRGAARKSSNDNSSVDGSYSGSSGGDGWSIFSWFGGDSSSSDSSGSPGDFGGGDSGGGGDGGD